MNRTFLEHKVRKSLSLDGEWQFITDPEGQGESLGYTHCLPEAAKRRYVPSVWNTDLGLLAYDGVAWYGRTFETAGGAARLHFGAVMTTADVWVDGEHVGHHYGGFTAFDVELPSLAAGLHYVSVKVDNTFDGASIPEKMVDWYHYGGITRSVTLEELTGICVQYLHAYYNLDVAARAASVTFRARVKNYDTVARTSPVTVAISYAFASEEVSLAAGESREVVFSPLDMTDISLWDMDSPNLYTISAITETDDLYDRMGFRQIKVEGGKLYLNGKSLTIKGVNRHEDHPDFGFAFPEGLMERDIDIIQHMNANAIRGSHYPNAKYFVDLLDERGMLFWSEIPIWGVGYTAEMLGQTKFVERAHTMILEMAEQYHNHPSIIFWGIHNEIATDSAEGLALSKLLYGEMKARDDGRLVTYACSRPMSDICFDYCDIICINEYHGWYRNEMEYWQDVVESFRARRKALGFEEKPVIYSEFGAAALYGHHTFDDIRWTEEYQARLLDHTINLFLSDEMIVGCYVWQYCDIRTSPDVGLNRARGYNNKGLVNEYRRPKQAYFAVKDAYSKY